jgi:hypothetical protein
MLKTDIRPLVATIDAELKGIPRASTNLLQSWARLVNTLALEAGAATLACPRCGNGVSLEALSCTRCLSTVRAATRSSR